MDKHLDDYEFRSALRAWLLEHAPEGLEKVYDWNCSTAAGWRDEGRMRATRHPLFREWEQLWLANRLVCAHWPEEYGGRGWSYRQRTILDQELHRQGWPRVDRGRGETLVGPTIIACGSHEQKTRFLPPIISGEHVYCQGFSEPGSGSDLASLSLRGAVDGDDLVLNGQKVWTSGAAGANMVLLLCRTGAGERKHDGITAVLVPMLQDNGVEVRPIRQITGESEFAEVFFNDVRAPLGNVLGEIGGGWHVAMATLMVERDFNLPLIALTYRKEFADYLDAVRKNGKTEDPLVRQDIADALIHVTLVELLGRRIVDSGPDEVGRLVSATKLFWSQYHQAISGRTMDVYGPNALVRPPNEIHDYTVTPWQYLFLYSRADTIYAGTSQVQRNIIAERILGLPK